jgi:hypothetical protein
MILEIAVIAILGNSITNLICVLVFDKTSSLSFYKDKKYQCPIGPEISKIKNDTDNSFFLNFQ